MTWYQLFNRIGKQTIKKTQSAQVIVKDNAGVEHRCKLEFYNNGSEFRLVMID